MARIFLSYNRSNVDTVTALVEDLKAARHELWFDSVLSGGQLWWDEILSNIRDCQIFLYALSKPSLESRACRAELQHALALMRPWIPVMIADDVSINLLPAPFDTVQFVDYRRQDKQAAIDLMTALMRMPAPGPLPQPLPEAPLVPLSYLRHIKDQIETTSALSLPEQTAIVTDLKEHLSEGRSALEVTELLKQLKRRDDLMAKVLSSIDTMLDGIPTASAASVPRNPEPVHSNQRVTDGAV
ncbi:MAG: toll/interleukin-1 receptor domain-containing protein [Chromatiales bacterium]